MRWPPWKAPVEQRADSSYTDALVASITANAGGQSTAFPTATAALEACAGFVGRAFATAEVKAPGFATGALDPATLSMIGRSLIRRGEVLFLIRVDRDGLLLLPAASYDVDGGPDPRSWQYRLTIGGPERTHTYSRQPAESVLHFTYARSPEHPWRGYGPLQVAQLAGRLSAETTAALADEASGPRGAFLPTPAPGQDESVGKIKGDIRSARGDLLMVQAGDWSDAGAAVAEWNAKRFGPSPPDGLVQLLDMASREVMAACGLSGALFYANSASSSREAYRQALHSTVAPLGRLVADELASKLEAPIAVDWGELRAGDIAGRARAFQALVTGGMSMDAAAAASGILIGETA